MKFDDSWWHFRGSEPLRSGASTSLVFIEIEMLLDEQNMIVTDRSEDRVSFYRPFFIFKLFAHYRAMYMYERGRFWIERDAQGQALRYDLSFLRLFVVFLIFDSFLFFFVFFAALQSPDPSPGPVFGAFFGVVAFCALYWVNVSMSNSRIELIIQQAICDAGAWPSKGDKPT